jgi:hypothetical protein
LSNKETKQVERENNINTCLETQSRRFSSTTIFPFVLPLFLVLTLSFVLTKSFFFPSREDG